MPGWRTRKCNFCMPTEEKLWGGDGRAVLYSLMCSYSSWSLCANWSISAGSAHIQPLSLSCLSKMNENLKPWGCFGCCSSSYTQWHERLPGLCGALYRHSTAGPAWGMSSPVFWTIWSCRLHGIRGIRGGRRCQMDFVATSSGRITIQGLGSWEQGHAICSTESYALKKKTQNTNTLQWGSGRDKRPVSGHKMTMQWNFSSQAGID